MYIHSVHIHILYVLRILYIDIYTYIHVMHTCIFTYMCVCIYVYLHIHPGRVAARLQLVHDDEPAAPVESRLLRELRAPPGQNIMIYIYICTYIYIYTHMHYTYVHIYIYIYIYIHI